jgi:hypothetical protein
MTTLRCPGGVELPATRRGQGIPLVPAPGRQGISRDAAGTGCTLFAPFRPFSPLLGSRRGVFVADACSSLLAYGCSVTPGSRALRTAPRRCRAEPRGGGAGASPVPPPPPRVARLTRQCGAAVRLTAAPQCRSLPHRRPRRPPPGVHGASQQPPASCAPRAPRAPQRLAHCGIQPPAVRRGPSARLATACARRALGAAGTTTLSVGGEASAHGAPPRRPGPRARGRRVPEQRKPVRTRRGRPPHTRRRGLPRQGRRDSGMAAQTHVAEPPLAIDPHTINLPESGRPCRRHRRWRLRSSAS